MNTEQSEIIKKFLLGLFRSALQALSALLIAKGVLSSGTADVLISQAAPILAGLVISGVTAYFQYKKAKENVMLPKAAYKADASTTTFETVKTEVKNKL